MIESTLNGKMPGRVPAPTHEVDLSVVIPVFNEEAIIPALRQRLVASLEPLGLDFEVILVDDGSRDQTPIMLADLCRQDARFRLLRFSRNFGHQAAVTAGIDHAAGKAVVVMDADLQDPPEMIGPMLEKWREGFEVVCGIRRKRKEGPLKRLAYFTFYRLMKALTAVDITLDAGDFALIDRRVADQLRALPERNRFVRGIRAWVGFRQTGIEYERDARFAGEVKYTFSKLVRLALDGIFSFSYMPLRLAIYVGLLTALTSFVAGLFCIYLKLVVKVEPLGWASTIATILFMGGVQLFTVGIIGEYVSRIYDEVKQRPVYILSERVGFN